MKRLVLILVLLAAPAFAVQPDEVLSDPALESRARALSEGLRCPVCRNESIDESNAGISRDMRLILRERLVAGDTDAEVTQFMVDRYGDYILLNPTTEGANIVLWLAAPFMLLLAGAIAVMSVRSRARGTDVAALTDEEKARLDDLLGR